MCFLFSLNYLRFPLTEETDSKKEPSNFAKLQFLTDNIDQKALILANFAKLSSMYQIFLAVNFISQ